MSWLIPLCAGLVLWGANWLLVHMAFYPVRPIGMPPWLGWQGIIPRRAPRIAERIAHSLTSELATVDEVFQVMGPDRIADHVIYSIRPKVSEIVEDTILECQPRLWDALDESCKRDIIVRVQRNLPRAVRNAMSEVEGNIERYANIDLLARRLLVERPHLLVRLIREIGAKEFRFLVYAGGVLGFFAGFLQLALWHVQPTWWTLPLAGFVIGIAINWLATQMIFRPINPIRIGPFRLHGLFLRRQEEASLVACRIFTRDILSVQHLVEAIRTGEHGDEVRAIVYREFRPVVHDALESRRGMITDVIRADEFVELEELLLLRIAQVAFVTFDDPVFNHERQVATEHTFLDRMLELTCEDFEQILRVGIIEEEKLLILGGGLIASLGGFLLYALLDGLFFSLY